MRDLLGHADPPGQAAALRHREMARHSLHVGIVNPIGCKLVVGSKQLEHGRALEDQIRLISSMTYDRDLEA
jgi:hypothetical protein